MGSTRQRCPSLSQIYSRVGSLVSPSVHRSWLRSFMSSSGREIVLFLGSWASCEDFGAILIKAVNLIVFQDLIPDDHGHSLPNRDPALVQQIVAVGRRRIAHSY